MDEVENPELAAMRARDLYRAKGYPDDWIEMRLKSIEVRQQLTDEWKNRELESETGQKVVSPENFKNQLREKSGHSALPGED